VVMRTGRVVDLPLLVFLLLRRPLGRDRARRWLRSAGRRGGRVLLLRLLLLLLLRDRPRLLLGLLRFLRLRLLPLGRDGRGRLRVQRRQHHEDGKKDDRDSLHGGRGYTTGR